MEPVKRFGAVVRAEDLAPVRFVLGQSLSSRLAGGSFMTQKTGFELITAQCGVRTHSPYSASLAPSFSI